jgi:release factor glutamine methyltransferase
MRTQPTSSAYEPMMSAARIERLRAWHEQAIRESKRDTIAQVTYLGRKLLIRPTVFRPTPVSPLLGKAVLTEVRPGERVLDLGTGSGINAILAASKGADVMAVDINPKSVACAKKNAERNAVGSHVQVFQSDLFQNVNGRFDLIIFDPPFRWFRARDMEERAIADENYITLTRFFKQFRKYLRPRSRVLLFFGTSGDIKYLRHMITQAHLRRKVVASKELVKDGWKVKYFTYKLY